ncbi:hypothetical protein [Phycicoccus sp.]|uniref:hypothetical protein n=1 Tax=Phycicoccus sp. TaxID=1902410 RepID=UPI002BAF280D|nr:hypothetical protein [Phycicoccus sp.]HMM93800.1 hypothetical protein [Phycicoccus sp.]
MSDIPDEPLDSGDAVGAVEDELLSRPDEADEADVIEQHQPVPDDEEDAPREEPG